MNLEIYLELPFNELMYRLEHRLFVEIASNIVYGFEEEPSGPLTLDEQRVFFARDDVRDAMKRIMIDFLADLSADEENKDGGIEDDWLREYIYKAKYLGSIYEQLHTRPNESLFESIPLDYSEYTPMFPDPS
jgi:hypothetical protein